MPLLQHLLLRACTTVCRRMLRALLSRRTPLMKRLLRMIHIVQVIHMLLPRRTASPAVTAAAVSSMQSGTPPTAITSIFRLWEASSFRD